MRSLNAAATKPKLVKEGFTGKVYMTPPTRDLTELMLKDTVGILRQDAERQHIAPLYTEQDVAATARTQQDQAQAAVVDARAAIAFIQIQEQIAAGEIGEADGKGIE